MVAVIQTGNQLRRVFAYNEEKVKTGAARFIHAENYPMEAAELNERQRLNMLLKTAEKNPNVKRNSVHISVNFAREERLDDEKLKAIATEYMDLIGFGRQPFLVYRHEDAGHPHIHIVSVKVRPDGSRIDMNNIGRKQSEVARLALEKKFGLVPAATAKGRDYQLQSAYTQQVEYGKAASKHAISNVLNGVLSTYRYASLPELNAVLKLYNVMADRCSEDSRVYKHRGLLYRILDDQGNPVGVPLKASLFHQKPTLKYLEKQFLKHDIERQQKKPATRNTINAVLDKYATAGLKEVIHQLGKKGVDAVLRQNKDGLIYGVTYVDHTTCCVFNGSALGKEFSAKGLLERCGSGISGGGQLPVNRQSKEVSNGNEAALPSVPQSGEPGHSDVGQVDGIGLLDILTQAEQTNSYVPYELRKKKKRKRKGL